MKRRGVRFSLQATQDLEWLYDIVAQASGSSRAFNYVERCREFCERLEYGAERGTMRDDVRAGLRIVGFERRVTVAFAVDEDQVMILRLFYAGRDWEAEFDH